MSVGAPCDMQVACRLRRTYGRGLCFAVGAGVQGVDENTFLSMREENMNLKREGSKNQQKMKEYAAVSLLFVVVHRECDDWLSQDGDTAGNYDAETVQDSGVIRKPGGQ